MPWRIVVFLLKFGLALNIFSFVLSCHEVSPRVPLMCFFASVTSSETSSSFPLQPRSSFMSVSSPSLSSPGRSASVSYTVDVSMFPWSASPVTPTFNEKLYPQHYHFRFLWWTFSLFDEFFLPAIWFCEIYCEFITEIKGKIHYMPCSWCMNQIPTDFERSEMTDHWSWCSSVICVLIHGVKS